MAIASRPKSLDPEYTSYVFVNAAGRPYCNNSNRVGVMFRALLERTGLYLPGRGHYHLRRQYRTLVDALGDGPAADLTMGHVTEGMGATYVQTIDNARLQRLADHVHTWLFE